MIRWFVVFLMACTAGTTGVDEEVTCDDCADGEACYAYLGDEATTYECVAAPTDCEASCSDDCRGLLYDGCSEGTIGTGCSEGEGSVVVSCTEDSPS